VAKKAKDLPSRAHLPRVPDLGGSTAQEISISTDESDALPELSQIHIKTAYYDESELPPLASASHVTASRSPKIDGMKRWEKIALAVTFSIILGFTAGAMAAVAILDGTFDVHKKELKAFFESLKTL
jgi:hypothetical protein